MNTINQNSKVWLIQLKNIFYCKYYNDFIVYTPNLHILTDMFLAVCLTARLYIAWKHNYKRLILNPYENKVINQKQSSLYTKDENNYITKHTPIAMIEKIY